MPWKKYLLTNMDINRVDLVNAGADDNAYIKYFKSKGGSQMELQEILAKMKPEHAKVVQDAMDEKAKEVPKETADKLKDLEKKVAEKKEEPKDDDEILKSLDPAVKSLIEKARTEAAAATAVIKKMKDEADNAEAIEKAKSIDKLGAKQEDLVSIYKSIKGHDEALAEQVFGIFKSANEVVSNGTAFTEVGTSITKSNTNTNPDDVWGEIQEQAKEISKSRKISVEDAVGAVLTEQPELYKKHLKSLRG